MRVAERNRRIKKELAKVFGYKNVKVKGGRGTAYGWVDVRILAKKPENCRCIKGDWRLCDECRAKVDRIKQKVWEVLEKTGLIDEIGIWYDDMNYKHKKITVDVELREDVEEREVEEKDFGSYKVVHEGSWTWVYFQEKPSEKTREKLKSDGFRFSRKRFAWYKPEKVEVSL